MNRRLKFGIVIWTEDLGFVIRIGDWDRRLRIGDYDWDWRLGLGIEIGIVESGFGLGDWDWGLGLGIEI